MSIWDRMRGREREEADHEQEHERAIRGRDMEELRRRVSRVEAAVRVLQASTSKENT